MKALLRASGKVFFGLVVFPVILVLAFCLGGCSHRVPAGVPGPFQDKTVPCPCAGPAAPAEETVPREQMAPKLRPENCPDDGIHVVVNGVCVDTNGK